MPGGNLRFDKKIKYFGNAGQSAVGNGKRSSLLTVPNLDKNGRIVICRLLERLDA